MEGFCYQIIKYTFKLLCVLATIAMACFWFYEYNLDEDLCLVDYKKYYETKDDVIPVFSI